MRWLAALTVGSIAATIAAQARLAGHVSPGTILAAAAAGLASWRLVRRGAGPWLSSAAVFTVFAGSPLLWSLVREPDPVPFLSAALGALSVLAWLRAVDRQTPGRWAVAGVAAGALAFAGWPAPALALLPVASAVSGAVIGGPAAHGRRRARPVVVLTGALVASAAVAAAARTWLGGPLEIPPPWPAGAVSLWPGSQFVDVLWSSAGGLLATSPALYAAAVGLVWVRARDRRLGSAVLAGCALVAWATAIIPAQNAPAVRAFAVAVPLLAFGIAAFAAAMARAVAARPGATAVAALALLVVWNVTLMSVARTGGFGIGQPLVFSDVAARQAETLHGWIGHPWSYPANLVYAASNGVAPSRFDLLYPGRLFARADQVSGRIDIGGDDAVYVGPGWHGRESEGDETFRWARARAEVLVPLARTGAFVVRVHLRPFEPADHREQRLVLVVGDRALPSMTLAGGWQALEVDTPRSAWRRGVNHLELRFAWEARPSDQGQPDPRPLAAAVDAIELADSRPAPAP